MTAEIRPRSNWEAIDLGISLVREHFGDISRIWALTVFPLCVLVLLASTPFSLFWGLCFVWWLKPLFERVVLFYLSRALFGEKPRVRAVLRAFPGMLAADAVLIGVGLVLVLSGYWVWNQGAAGMEVFRVIHFLVAGACLFYRSMPNRALALPVRMLENLGGKSARVRLAVLARRGTAAVALMVLSMILELGLLASLFYLVLMLVPTETMVDWELFFQTMFDDHAFFMLPVGLGWFLALLYFVAMSLTAWFFTGGGFALYLNARTLIEGWDVELEFKKMGRRFSGGTPLLLALLCLFSASGTGILRGQESLDEILAGEDFKIEKKETRRWVSDKKSSSSSSGGVGAFVQAFGQILFWALVTLAIVGLVCLIYRNRHVFTRSGPSGKTEKKERPKPCAG